MLIAAGCSKEGKLELTNGSDWGSDRATNQFHNISVVISTNLLSLLIFHFLLVL